MDNKTSFENAHASIVYFAAQSRKFLGIVRPGVHRARAAHLAPLSDVSQTTAATGRGSDLLIMSWRLQCNRFTQPQLDQGVVAKPPKSTWTWEAGNESGRVCYFNQKPFFLSFWARVYVFKYSTCMLKQKLYQPFDNENENTPIAHDIYEH